MTNKTIGLDDINALLGDDLSCDELSELDKDLAVEASVDTAQEEPNTTELKPALEDKKPVEDLSDVYDDLDKELDAATSTAPVVDEAPPADDTPQTESEPEPETPPVAAESTPIPRTRVRNAGKPVSTFITDDTLAAIGQTRDTVDELVESLPVKARDKFKNLVNFLQSGVALHIYTEICLNTLIDEGMANSCDFRCGMMEYKPKPYTVGTATSQAGQIMSLFPALKIAERKGNVLHINLDSAFIKAFMKLKDAA